MPTEANEREAQQVLDLIENLRDMAERDQSPGDRRRLTLREAANTIESLASTLRAPNVAEYVLAGWIVTNGSGDRYRTWKDGWSAWTAERDEATRYARRIEAEAVHAEDDDAWRIEPFAASPQVQAEPASNLTGLDDKIDKVAKSSLSGDYSSVAEVECHGLDTPERVCFYEQDFYVLSNFSAFQVRWGPYTFMTSEHLYHWRRFFLAGGPAADRICAEIMSAASAHEAFKVAQANKVHQVEHWDEIKVAEMHGILRDKADQHEYVRRKLLATGDRELVENSWRDDFWGWGPNCDGQNMLGKAWMQVRADLRAALNTHAVQGEWGAPGR